MTIGNRRDGITPLVTFGGAATSTFLLNWLKRKTSTLTKITNLSSKYLVFESCDGANAEIPSIPRDMKPKWGITHFESFNPATILGNFIEKLAKRNIWVRCSFLTNFEDIENFKDIEDETTYHPRTKITILVTVRGISKTYDTDMESAMAIGMCRKKSPNDCWEYDAIQYMSGYVDKALADWRAKEDKKDPKDVAVPQPDLVKTRTGAERDKDEILGKLEKPTPDDEMRIMIYSRSEEVDSKPMYFCNTEAGHCISAIMGSGTSSESEVFVHDLDGDLPKSIDPDMQ